MLLITLGLIVFLAVLPGYLAWRKDSNYMDELHVVLDKIEAISVWCYRHAPPKVLSIIRKDWTLILGILIAGVLLGPLLAGVFGFSGWTVGPLYFVALCLLLGWLAHVHAKMIGHASGKVTQPDLISAITDKQ